MTTFKTKMIMMKPSPTRKAKIAAKEGETFSNPLVGAAMANDQFRDQGGKLIRVKHEKLWARTKF